MFFGTAKLIISSALTNCSENKEDFLYLRYGRTKKLHRMACFWGLYQDRGNTGHPDNHYPEVFYLYLMPNFWLTGHFLPCHSFLDEYQAIFHSVQTQPAEVQLIWSHVISFNIAILHIS